MYNDDGIEAYKELVERMMEGQTLTGKDARISLGLLRNGELPYVMALIYLDRGDLDSVGNLLIICWIATLTSALESSQ